MEKPYSPAIEQLKIFLWVIVVVEAFIFGLALMWGGSVGYQLSLTVHFWIGLLVAIIFFILIGVYYLLLYCLDAWCTFRDRRKNNNP